MSYQTVPFSEAWITSEKIDAKAIYRRPHRHAITLEILRDENGAMRWDFSALPVRRHNDWLAKGFEYVTIADAESLGMVAGSLRAQGLDPRSFIADPRTNSPWHPDKYAAILKQDVADEYEKLRAFVEKHGAEAAEDFLGRPVPEALRGLGPKGAPKIKAGAAA